MLLYYARIHVLHKLIPQNRIKTADTIRIGGMVIIKRGGGNEGKKQTTVTIGRRKEKHSNISTAHWIVDLGFANYTDKTDYAAATSQRLYN